MGHEPGMQHADHVRVLYVEDSNTQADLLQSFLADERVGADASVAFTVSRVADLAGALAQLTRPERFDVVLLDLTLPDSDGVDTLVAVREVTDLPVVVLSAADASAGFETVANGAQDFVVKDRKALAGLPRALRYSVLRASMNRELQAALAAREDADARLRTYVSMASHELRSPIAALQGLSQLLNDRWEELPESQRQELAQRIGRRLGHMHAVATLYLNAAAGNEDIHAVPVDVDVAALCADVVQSVPTPPAVVDVGPGTVHIDPSHLAAILVNFLTNAAKYGESPVHLEGGPDRLVVSDGGEGVSDENVAELFEAWHRRAAQGVDSTGLGLALAAELAEANGARLSYERIDGRTCFAIEFSPVSGVGGATSSTGDEQQSATVAGVSG